MNVTPIRDTSAQDRPIEPSQLLGRRRTRLIIGTGIGVVVLAGIVTLSRHWMAAEASVSRQEIRVAEVTRGPFVRDVASQGTVVAAVSPTLYAEAPGTVHFAVHAGDSVKRGAALATLDSPELRNELQREQATSSSLELAVERQSIETRRQLLANQQAIDLAKVTVTAAEREHARARESYSSHIISQRDFQKASDDEDAAQINYRHSTETATLQKESLEFELKAKRLERDRQRLLVQELQRKVTGLEVRSPVDGMVGTLAVNESASVLQNSALLSVVDLSAFEVEFQVPDSYADSLGIGMAAEVSYGNEKFPAKVSAVSPEVRQGQVTGRLQFASAVPKGLRQNQRLSLRIIMDARDNVLKVARGPFLDADGGRTAFVIHGDVATKTPISTGAASIADVEITGGLSAGDQVIVSDVAAFAKASNVRLSN
jgi:HlyD family secretion protein